MFGDYNYCIDSKRESYKFPKVNHTNSSLQLKCIIEKSDEKKEKNWKK